MNKSKLLFGTLLVGALGAGAYFTKTSETPEAQYTTAQLETKNDQKDLRSYDAYQYWLERHKNIHTGQFEQADYEAAKEAYLKIRQQKSGLLTFSELGPDNVGGRTRAIIVDPSNELIVYAASVSGGLFKSTDGGNSWTKLLSWDGEVQETLQIGSMCITNNGTLYVGTGIPYNEPGFHGGNGIYYSTDGGATFSSSPIAGTANRSCYKLVNDPSKTNSFYYISGSSQYLKRCNDGDGTPVIDDINNSNGIGSQASTGADVKVSPDGQHILYCGFSRVYVSNDGGATFTEKIGSSTSQLWTGIGRIEGAVSQTTTPSGNYTMYVVGSSGGNWGGAWMSEDNGITWYQIANKWVNPGANVPFDLQFNPLNSGGGSPQGGYNLVCEVVHGDPYSMILGGIDTYKWTKEAGSNPPYGQFERLSFWFLNPSSPSYVHADNHRFTWSPSGRLYIGNDGGIGIGLDSNLNIFTASNKGYNTTQYYGISAGPDGEVLGGTQDNGSLYNNRTNFTGLSFTELTGGDGFECALSNLKNGGFVSTSQYGSYNRGDVSVGAGGAQGIAAPCGGDPGDPACAQFGTVLGLFEDDNDMDTQDSIQFIPVDDMAIGDTARYVSTNFDLELEWVLTEALDVQFDSLILPYDSVTPTFDTILANTWYFYNPVPLDTIMLPNYAQALLAVTTSSGTYVTRDVWNFSLTPRYTLVSNTTNANVLEWSKDGNTLWIGNGTTITRITGFDSAYVDAQMNIDSLGTSSYELETTTISTSGFITDICVDPTDPNIVAYTNGGSGGNNIFYSTDALAASPTFTAKDGNLPSYTANAIELIRSPQNNVTMVVGTDFGAFATDDDPNGSVTWTAVDQETDIVPVYDIVQQWRDWGSMFGNVKNPGELYIGTFGAGIWTSSDVASTEDYTPETIEEVNTISDLVVYPNPMSSEGAIKFDLNVQTDVDIAIYNLQGKVVKRINSRNLVDGSHNINFNVADFAKGTYITVLNANDEQRVAKFIVQ